jgi:beta-glucosidase
MGLRGRNAAILLAVIALGLLGAGSVIAAGRSSDQTALQPARHPADRNVERRVNALLRQMTLQEKLNQLTLLSDGQINDTEAAKPVGGVFSLTDPVKINHYQHVAMEQSRLHIPILFAYDTIHGYRTIFPIPLGTASSFDSSVAQTDHRIGAFESAAIGIKQIYSPMVDVSHEPRWGRISEAAGEDPYLNSVMAAARVKGAQGSDYSAPDKVVTSMKHFVAYGQPESGRDYNTTDMSIQRLWNFYLPPFKAAYDAGSDTAMCSFNALNGVPGCANPYTETRVLKQRWGFDGFIESDYTAVAELRACPPVNPDSGPCGHGVAADGPDAARQALNAGTDQEMVSTNFRDFGPQLVSSGQVPMSRIDDAAAPGQPHRGAQGGGPLNGAAQERPRRAALRSSQDDRGDRTARQRSARHARPLVGPGSRRRCGVGVRRHQEAESERHLHARLHAQPQRPLRPGQRVRVGRRLRCCGGRRPVRRSGRDRGSSCPDASRS